MFFFSVMLQRKTSSFSDLTQIPGNKFVPNLSQRLEWGATKLRVDKMADAENGKRAR